MPPIMSTGWERAKEKLSPSSFFHRSFVNWHALGSTKGNVLQVSKAVNLLELVLALADLRTLNVLFQVVHRRDARNRQDRWGAVQQPGQGNPTGSRLVLPGNLVQDTAWTALRP